MELEVHVLGLNYSCKIQLGTKGGVCKEVCGEICAMYARDYPNAEVPQINCVYKAGENGKKVRIRSREYIRNVFNPDEICYVGMKKACALTYQNENQSICKYDFTVVFHTRDVGFRYIFDGAVYRIGKVYSSKAAAYFPRLLPGTLITHIENDRIDGLDATELKNRLETMNLPARIGFKGTSPPTAPKRHTSIPLYTSHSQSQVVLSPLQQNTKTDSKTQEQQIIKAISSMFEEVERKKQEIVALEQSIRLHEEKLAALSGESPRLSQEALQRLHPPSSPVCSEKSTYSAICRKYKTSGARSSAAPSIRSDISRTSSRMSMKSMQSERHSYIRTQNHPGVGDYNIPSGFGTKGGQIPRAKTSRSSYIPNTSGPGVGKYLIPTTTRVKGGEIGDSSRELRWV